MDFFDILDEAANTHRERNKVYGKNYVKFGAIMDSLFPDGLTVKGPDEWVKFGLYFMQIVKLSRNAESFLATKDFDQDTTHDTGVYSFMLEEVCGMLKED